MELIEAIKLLGKADVDAIHLSLDADTVLGVRSIEILSAGTNVLYGRNCQNPQAWAAELSEDEQRRVKAAANLVSHLSTETAQSVQSSKTAPAQHSKAVPANKVPAEVDMIKRAEFEQRTRFGRRDRHTDRL